MKTSDTPHIPQGAPAGDTELTPGALNRLILSKAEAYVSNLNQPAGPLPERMRKMLAQPGFLFRRQAE